MTLDEYLTANKKSDAAFAREIDVSRVSVGRYRSLRAIPIAPIMARIVRETGGAVTANDFYQIEAAE